MDELDLWKDTTLIVRIDHGYMLGGHDCRDKNFILDNYDHPIFEGNKQLKDMVCLRMPL